MCPAVGILIITIDVIDAFIATNVTKIWLDHIQ